MKRFILGFALLTSTLMGAKAQADVQVRIALGYPAPYVAYPVARDFRPVHRYDYRPYRNYYDHRYQRQEERRFWSHGREQDHDEGRFRDR